MTDPTQGLSVSETGTDCPYCGVPLKVITAAKYNAEA